jgi:NAD(P)-dependent dehydrogenase (short-subunit alcohol dehydrogenase family)
MTSADDNAVPDYSSLLRLDGKGFIVLGAGQGMGRQTAHALSSQGARVLCVDIDEGLAKEVAEEVGGVAAVADGRSEEDVARVVAEARAEFGRLNGLCDVVGMARYGALVDMPADDWDWCHDMVVRHAFYLVKHGGRAIAEDGGGSMAFVASISGISSAPYHGAYGVAKAGLISLVRTAAVELKASQVRVNAVAPGNTATPRAARSRGQAADVLVDGTLGGYGSTSDIASALLFLSCPLSRHITGQTLAVDGGDLVKYPHDVSAPPLPPGKAMGEAPMPGVI